MFNADRYLSDIKQFGDLIESAPKPILIYLSDYIYQREMCSDLPNSEIFPYLHSIDKYEQRSDGIYIRFTATNLLDDKRTEEILIPQEVVSELILKEI